MKFVVTSCPFTKLDDELGTSPITYCDSVAFTALTVTHEDESLDQLAFVAFTPPIIEVVYKSNTDNGDGKQPP